MPDDRTHGRIRCLHHPHPTVRHPATLRRSSNPKTSVGCAWSIRFICLYDEKKTYQPVCQYIRAGPTTTSQRQQSPTAVEDLLHANVLPHLPDPVVKMTYLAYTQAFFFSFAHHHRRPIGWMLVRMVGVLLNHMLDAPSRASQLYDKDFLHSLLFYFCMHACETSGETAGNKRVEVCGILTQGGMFGTHLP